MDDLPHFAEYIRNYYASIVQLFVLWSLLKDVTSAGGLTDILGIHRRQKNLLWGQISEELSYWPDSYHGNQSAWQLMFHPHINYGMPLRRRCFFPCRFLSLFSSLVSFASLFSPVLCDTYRIYCLYNRPCDHIVKVFHIDVMNPSKLYQRMTWSDIYFM